MKNLLLMASFVLASAPALSDNVGEAKRLLCAQGQVMVCLHSADCAFVPPEAVASPQFVVLDTRKKTVATTQASGDGRSSKLASLSREGGLIMAQGKHDERAFSFVIDEATGTFTLGVIFQSFH